MLFGLPFSSSIPELLSNSMNFTQQRRTAPETLTGATAMSFRESAMASADVSTPELDRIIAKGRYPKRTRTQNQVSYAELEDEDEFNECVGGEDYEEEDDICPPPSKRARISKPTRAPKPNKIFPFMQLPPELRNKIYRECLASNQYDKEGRPTLYFDSTTRNFRNTIKLVQRSGVGEEIHPDRMYRQYYGGQRVRPNDEDEEVLKEQPLKQLVPALLATCKSIYAEAAPLMYSQRFCFSDCLTLHNFMVYASHTTAAQIKHIEVRSWSQRRSRGALRGFIAPSLMAGKGCINLESFRITSSLGYFHSYSWRDESRSIPLARRIARKVYRDCFPWLDAVGIKAGDMYKGIEALDIGDWTFMDTSRYTSRYHVGGPEADEKAEFLTKIRAEYRKELKLLIAKNAGLA